MHLRLLPVVLLIVVLFILLQVIGCLDVFLHAEPSMHNAARKEFHAKKAVLNSADHRCDRAARAAVWSL